MIDSLQADCIRIGSTARTKEALLKEISEIAGQAINKADFDSPKIEKALLEREELCSTGLGSGLAIPHCSFEGLDDFTVGLIILKDGIDFDSLDGKDVNLVFFIVGASEKRNKHIKILSSISKIMKDAELSKKLLSSESAAEVLRLLKREDSETIQIRPFEKVQFTIHVQDEEIFNDVLEILSSEVEGDVSVLESSTAGSYLHKLPLFSTFWNDSSKSFSKVIIAVIDKRLMNDCIRRINLVRPASRGGILISVSDILYFDGSIDF